VPPPLAIPVDGQLAGRDPAEIAVLAAEAERAGPGSIYDIEVRGLRRPCAAPRPAPPVWLAAVLPGMTALAGEVADGFLDHPVTTPACLADDATARCQRGILEALGPRDDA
jgi:hypothetical protein